MTAAVIVSTTCTSIRKAYCGALNDTEEATLLGQAVDEAVGRGKFDPKDAGDGVTGAALHEGSIGGNIAPKAVLRASVFLTVGVTN